ncbi:hypothetical protein MNB_SUP05-SYMBIONT-5-1056 [hydrothermal vent metagenome]|uniref:Uncharacterized protein n=1 Tax=hydrothermal vent metagenome TaxID=652676 RepID=A0A1W1E6P7_9ZZZZ
MESKKYTQLNDQLQTMDTYIITPEKQTELGIDAEKLQQFQRYFDSDCVVWVFL